MQDKKLTILIVDDTETNIDVLLNLLDNYDVAVAVNGKSALDIVENDKIDLILLDIMMPEMDGYEVCEKIKSNPKTKDIPIIFITARSDEDSIEKAYDIGGIDYVTKPFKPKELLARVKTHLEMRVLIKNLNFLASHDSLTGIYNRRKFFELSQKEFTTQNNLFAIMIDIDDFKAINDTYGHNIGDKVIINVTKTISNLLKDNYIFGRLGGEEFGIILVEDSIDTVKQTIEDIRKSVESIKVKSNNSKDISVTISSGIAQKNIDILNLDCLLKEADSCLYEAKGKGKNRSVIRQ